jgi:dTDP-glucose pyrophosphorylase/thiamine kinase-like enzyme
MPNRKNGIILTAAKVDDGLSQLFGEIPPALIPVNGKPLIFHQIENFIQYGVSHIYISVGYNKKRLISLVKNYYAERVNLEFITVDYKKPPGHSLLTCLKIITEGEVTVILGDTFLPNKNLVEKSNQVFVSKSINQSRRWSKVQINESGNINFLEKESNGNLAIIGVYQIADIKGLVDNIKINDFEITEVLKLLDISFKAVEENGWLDFGHLDKYQSSKKRLLEARSFNSLEFNDKLGTITKKSTNINKFLKEIEWQLNVPKELKVLSPRVIDYSLTTESPFVEMEYYSYPTLSEIWLYSSFDDSVLKRVISKTFEILLCFLNHKHEVSQKSYDHIYIEKTNKRVDELITNHPTFKKFLSKDYLFVNGKKLKNWNLLKEKVFSLIPELYKKDHNCFIHGDYCFSNILFDINSGIIRLIDPRGIWGESKNGDIKYDVAKLRHSINGDYDFIVQDLFEIQDEGSSLNYKVYNSTKHLKIKQYFDELVSKEFDLKQIQLIEGLLFLSMIPLHENNERRQKVMLCKALENFNQL